MLSSGVVQSQWISADRAAQLHVAYQNFARGQFVIEATA